MRLIVVASRCLPFPWALPRPARVPAASLYRSRFRSVSLPLPPLRSRARAGSNVALQTFSGARAKRGHESAENDGTLTLLVDVTCSRSSSRSFSTTTSSLSLSFPRCLAGVSLCLASRNC